MLNLTAFRRAEFPLEKCAPVRRWFGPPERCPESERICQPYVKLVIKEPCYYIKLWAFLLILWYHCLQISNNEISYFNFILLPRPRTNNTFAKNRTDEHTKELFLRQLLGDGFAGCENVSFTAKDVSGLIVEPTDFHFFVEIGPK